MNWINVKDKLPELDQNCLVTDGQLISIQEWTDNGNGPDWNDCARITIKQNGIILDEIGIMGFKNYSPAFYLLHENITHWMPLPKLPKENK